MQRISSVQNRFNYLIPLFLIPIVGTFGHYVAPNEAIFKGQDWGIIGSFLLAGIAVLLWLPRRFDFNWNRTHLIFFVVSLALWLLQTISTQLDDSLFNLSAFLFPLVVVLIWAKNPDSAMVSKAFLFMLYGLLLIGLLSLVLGEIGLTSNGFYGVDSGVWRIPFLGDIFGIETRWAGPFGSVNYAAPIGGLLLVSGFAFAGANRALISFGGLVVLTLSQGRTTLVAVLAAGLVLAAYSNVVVQSAHRIQYRLLLVLGPAIALGIYILTQDPTLAFRTQIWLNFFELFLSKPLTGVGFSGVGEFINEQMLSDPLFIPHNHAHSVYLDLAARYGVLALFLTVALFVTVFTVVWRRRLSDKGIGLSILIFVSIAGISETIYSWQYCTVYFLTLIYVLFTCSEKNPSENDVDSIDALNTRHHVT
jgi:O-antigen ligase